jgi:hypothetical protein
MDSNIEEYLSTYKKKANSLLDETNIDFFYERKVSVYRSSTVMVSKSWGDTLVICGEERHYEEFV